MKSFTLPHGRAVLGALCVTVLLAAARLSGEEPAVPAQPSEAVIQQLLEKLAQHEARIQELEERLASREALPTAAASLASGATETSPAGAEPPSLKPVSGVRAASEASGVAQVAGMPNAASSSTNMITAVPAENSEPHDHTINLPNGGPALKIRGYTDFNFDVGQNGNPLIYPLGTTAHNTFQIGEFDLFMTSKLSEHLSFLSELVVGADTSNQWGLDIERMQLTYRANRYFELSGGRFHTAIGYYNTQFHHGTWFQTATGRPFMYYFEDSGGLLPVHSVGLTATGLVPGTGRVGLHWIAETGNGRSTDPTAQAVQNFLSDRNHKFYNLAAYVRPEWMPGLQIGANSYHDRLFPEGVTQVSQSITGVYAIFTNARWEIMNEGVLLRNVWSFNQRSYNTPLMYTQVSRNLGDYTPYFRYQYINSSQGDPLNGFKGRYQGPSFGIRYNISPYASMKWQYNRLYQSGVSAVNGFDTQLAFTF